MADFSEEQNVQNTEEDQQEEGSQKLELAKEEECKAQVGFFCSNVV